MFNPVCVCGHKEHWHNATGCEGLHDAGCSGCSGFEESEDSRSRNPRTAEASAPLRELGELVLSCWDGNTGGWHACDKAEWDACSDRELVGSGPAWRVTLGRLFVDDHMGRDLPAGIVVARNKRTYTLLMTVDDIRELYSDASHYGDGGMDEWYERENRDVVQAARRVMAGLEKQVAEHIR